MNFPCGNSLLRDTTLTCYHHRTMYMWVKTEKYIYISNIRIKAQGSSPFLKIHHPLTLDSSTLRTKNNVPKKIHKVGLSPIVNYS